MDDTYSDKDNIIGLEYQSLGNDYFLLGDYDKAVEHYSHAISIKPDLHELYFNRALAYSRLKDFKRALEDQNTAISLNPRMPQAHYTRGLIFEYMQEWDNALKDFEFALKLDPTFNEAFRRTEIVMNKRKGV